MAPFVALAVALPGWSHLALEEAVITTLGGKAAAMLTTAVAVQPEASVMHP